MNLSSRIVFACRGLLGVASICVVSTGWAQAVDVATSVSRAASYQLYQERCEACHGKNGDGTGRAARYVFPPPRNLRRGRYSLVSSTNRVATSEDIYRVIRDGMPGTSMKPFDDLPEEALRSLVNEVLRFRREGMNEQYLEVCRQLDEEPVEDEARAYVEQNLTPSTVLSVAPFETGGPDAIERGRQLFQQQACSSCHGADGTGTSEVALRDAAGHELRARDLAWEPFKGGRSNESVYRRIRLGFPSGPMPAHSGLTEAQTRDLVHFVQSLSRQPKRVFSNHQLRRYSTRGLYVTEMARLRNEEAANDPRPNQAMTNDQ